METVSLIYWLLFFVIILGVFVGFFKIFEKSKPSVENIVMIAILIAMSALGTLPTTSIPGVQVASFIIIMTGIIFGEKTGFITGALTPLVIGLFLGLGLWIILQMLGWGLMGLTAGILSKSLQKNTYLRGIFGFSWGILYGWINNIFMLQFLSNISFGSVIGLYVKSFPFDFIHGSINAILLITLFEMFKRIFSRVEKKYFIDSENIS